MPCFLKAQCVACFLCYSAPALYSLPIVGLKIFRVCQLRMHTSAGYFGCFYSALFIVIFCCGMVKFYILMHLWVCLPLVFGTGIQSISSSDPSYFSVVQPH